jgi:hypothetical protein
MYGEINFLLIGKKCGISCQCDTGMTYTVYTVPLRCFATGLLAVFSYTSLPQKNIRDIKNL